MSFGDMLVNQLDEDSNHGVIVDRDVYNDHRIMVAKRVVCPTCAANSGKRCVAVNPCQDGIHGEWVHVKREIGLNSALDQR